MMVCDGQDALCISMARDEPRLNLPEWTIPERARHDSNVRPLAPEASALSTELRAQADWI